MMDVHLIDKIDTNKKFVEVSKILDSIKLISDIKSKKELLRTLQAPSGPLKVAFINKNSFNILWNDVGFRAALLNTQCLLRDGVGLEVFFRAVGKHPGLNTNGTDLIPELLECLKPSRVVLLGTRPPWLQGAADHIRSIGHEVIEIEDGFQSYSRYLEICRTGRPDLVILGMGSPKQEIIADKLSKDVVHPCVIVSGGAILDFFAGRFSRAPAWVRACRLEWLYRFFREPKRLFKRYMLGGFLFIVRFISFVVVSRINNMNLKA